MTPDYDLGHYLRPLRRQQRLLVGFVLVGLVIGLAYSLLSGSTYSSAATLVIAPPPVLSGQPATAAPAGGRTSGSIDPDTEAQNVKSTTVLALALTSLHSSTPIGSLRSRISVTVPPNSTDLRIGCTARSAKSAQACASAVSNAYLTNRSTNEKALIGREITATNAQISQINAKIKKDGQVLAAAPHGTLAHNIAYQTQQQDLGVHSDLVRQVNALSTVDTSPGQIISPANPGAASKANKGIPPITGLIVGLILAVATIFGRERFDRFVRHSDDLKHSGVGLIAEIQPPRGRGRRQRSEAGVRTRFDQRVASVVAGAFDEHGGVIYVAPVSPEQRRDDVAERLGATLASVGHHVEIVRPAAVEVVSTVAVSPTPVAAAIGAAEPPEPVADEPSSASLGWPMPPEEARARVEQREVAVRSTPTEIQPSVVHPTVEPAESVPMSIRLRLEMARRHAQFVIIDGDPAVTDAQAYVLAGLSDATMLTVDPEATTKADLDEVVDQIAIAGSELLGAVIWRPARVGGSSADDGDAPTRHNGRGFPVLRKPVGNERAATNGSVLPTLLGKRPSRLDAAH